MDKTVIIQPESGLQYDWKAIAADPSGKHEPQKDVIAYKAYYINKIAQVRARGQEPVLVSLPIIDENRFFASITRGFTMQERANLLYWLGGKTERLRNMQDVYNIALFRLAAQQCVHIIDITTPMLSNPHYDELLEQDGVTLSSSGEQLLSSHIRLGLLAG